MNIWKQTADIQTADMLNLNRPDVEYHNVIAKPTDEQKRMVAALGERAEAVRSGAVDPSTDNMLAITNDGRKLALDQRLADIALPDEPESKLNQVVANTYKIWKDTTDTRSTQIIFCDLATPSAKSKGKKRFDAYDDIRDKLIARGVPPEEIAYIHDANTPYKKYKIRNQMNAGKIRILLGSTAKMGAGFNVQKKLVALHHCDCPWRPRDVEQREGRILRQGNTNAKVHIYRYVTEGTFDSYNWQTVENKQKFISQVMTSKSPARSCEDVDDAALSYAEVKALAAGDPKIRERMELEVEVNKLAVLRSTFQSDKYQLQDDIRITIPNAIAKKESLLEVLRQDNATYAQNHVQTAPNTFHMRIAETDFIKKEDAGQALLECIEKEHYKIRHKTPNAIGENERRQIGSYCGFKITLSQDVFHDPVLSIEGKSIRTVDIGNSAQGMIQRLNNALDGISAAITDTQNGIARLHEQLDAAKEEVEKPWAHEEQYQIKIVRLNELNYLLSKKESEPQQSLTDKSPALA